MERLELRLLGWSLVLTLVFAGVFLLVARLDPYPLQQLEQLRQQAAEAQVAYGLPAPPRAPPDSGRLNLPPYIGRGRLEMFFWAAWIALLGAFGSWRLARPFERPLRHLAESCRALQLGQPWSSPPVTGPLAEVGRDFARMLASLQEQERELQLATEAAQQALDGRERLLCHSHAEFREPLVSMLASLDGIPDHAYLTPLRRNLEALLQLVDDLARQRGPQPEKVELSSWLREALSGLDGRVRISQGPPVQLALDPLRTRQVLLNLVGNALKFSSGEVEVSWGRDWIEVADRGPGIEPSRIPEALQPFRQLEPSPQGAGLGLATARRWMELQGGRLELESQPGSGTRARLNFAGAGA